MSVAINRNWKDIYEAFWRPEDFQKWASGLSNSLLTQDGDGWKADGPEGTVKIRFTEHNDFGVMDHYVIVSNGSEIYVPLRIIQNGDGVEVLLTLFRQPYMSDAKFTADTEWVERDLLTLAPPSHRFIKPPSFLKLIQPTVVNWPFLMAA
jgi:hypothetical protein